jgi:hypothetical protein
LLLSPGILAPASTLPAAAARVMLSSLTGRRPTPASQDMNLFFC